MSHTTDSMTFEIFVRISFSSILLFPGQGDIQNFIVLLVNAIFANVDRFASEEVILELIYKMFTNPYL